MFNEAAYKTYMNNLYKYKTDYTIKTVEQAGFEKDGEFYIGNKDSFEKLDNSLRTYFGYKVSNALDIGIIHCSNLATMKIIIVIEKDVYKLKITGEMGQ